MKRILLFLLFSTAVLQASSVIPPRSTPTIGGAIVGGTDNSVLFVNPAGTFAQSSSFNYVTGTGLLTAPALRSSSLGLGLVHSDASGNFTSSLLVNADVSGSAAIAYSKLNLSNSILNADINTSAAIAYSKLALSNSILNADINTSAAIAYSKLALSNSILNADINTSAAIARTKTASGTAYRILANNVSGVMSENAAITASRAVSSDANGQLVAATTTAAELNFVNGVTSSIQTQLNARVTSVGVSVPGSSILSVSGSPVTGSGTIAIATTGTSGGIPYFSSTSQLLSSPLLTLNGVVVGGGVGSSPISTAAGATGQVLKGVTGNTPTFGAVSLTADVSGTLPIASGGTNTTTAPVNGGVAYGTGTAIAYSVVGTAGQILQSNGAGAPTWVTKGSSANDSTSLANGGFISIVTTQAGVAQHWRVASSGGQVTLSTTPFGTTNPPDRSLICLIGTSNTNPVVIPVNDAADGVVGNGDTVLGQYDSACFRYLSTEDRFVLESRSP